MLMDAQTAQNVKDAFSLVALAIGMGGEAAFLKIGLDAFLRPSKNKPKASEHLARLTK